MTDNFGKSIGKSKNVWYNVLCKSLDLQAHWKGILMEKEIFYNIMGRVYTNVRSKKDVVLSPEEKEKLKAYARKLGSSYEDAKERSQKVGVDLEAYVSFYKRLLDLYLVSGGVNPSVDNIGLELDETFNNN